MIGGRYAVHQPSRQTRLGWCHALSTPDGQQYAGLRLDSTDPAALARLDAAVQAATATELPGLVPVVDRILHDDGLWLISSAAGGTLAQALGAGAPVTGADAALIATDTAQTLLKLHRAGLVHGDVNPATVVLSAQGAALLDQAGYAHALDGTAALPEADTTGWARVLGQLAMRCADAQVATLLRQAAAQAESIGGSAGLGAALRLLGPALAQVGGFGDRAALAAFAASVQSVDAPSAAATPSPPAVSAPIRAVAAVPVPPSVPAQPPAAHPAPVSAPAAQPQAAHAGPVAPCVDGATRLGQRAAEQHQQHQQPAVPPAPAASPEVLRFGKGVPSTVPSWQQAATAVTVGRPRRSPFRRISSILSTALTLVLLIVVGLYLWQRFNPDPIVITEVTVGTAEPVKGKCNVNVDLVGTLRTNGEAGSISYEWLLSDGRREGPLTQAVRQGEATTQVHLFWKFTGTGTLDAKATLRILTPAPQEASTEFTYACR